MSTKRKIYLIIATMAFTSFSCEKEKIEYKKNYSGSFFSGFLLDKFIINDESISYYDPDSNKIFSNLFEHQNGKKLGKSVHSLNFISNVNGLYGIITLEGENSIVIVDKNFVLVKQIALYRPRNISIAWGMWDNSILVSYGDANDGGIAVLSPFDFSIVNKISTGNTAGEIFFKDYIYVLSNGENDADSTMVKIYYGDGPYSMQKIEDIVVGKNPVTSFYFREKKTGNFNDSRLIYCLGSSGEKPKIVLFDLVLNRIIKSYNFNHGTKKSNSILEFISHSNEIIYNSNNKVYLASLDNLESPELLSERNIVSLERVILINECPQNNCVITQNGGAQEYYIGISGENNGEQQYMFRFNADRHGNNFFELMDFIPIDAGARKIADWGYYY